MNSKSVLVWLVAVAAGLALALGVYQSSVNLRSHNSQRAPVAAASPDPATVTPPMRIIVPAGFDAPAGEFIGTGDHSAGEWVK